jgi:hypothetical protein
MTILEYDTINGTNASTAMRAMTTPDVNDVYVVQGYNTVGDGGGAVYLVHG